MKLYIQHLSLSVDAVDLSIMRDMKIIRGQKTAQFARITSQPTQYGPLEPISLSISYGLFQVPFFVPLSDTQVINLPPKLETLSST